MCSQSWAPGRLCAYKMCVTAAPPNQLPGTEGCLRSALSSFPCSIRWSFIL